MTRPQHHRAALTAAVAKAGVLVIATMIAIRYIFWRIHIPPKKYTNVCVQALHLYVSLLLGSALSGIFFPGFLLPMNILREQPPWFFAWNYSALLYLQSYQDEDWNEDGFDQEPGTVARLFSADRADAVKACLCPATSHSSDSFAADSAASETNGAFLGPIALNLNDLAWAWEAPTAGLNVEGTSAELGTETGYSSTAAASTPASASESSLGAGLSVSSTRDPLWPPPLQPLPPLVVPWALPPLGQGSFGVVYACLWRGKLSAVKYQRMPPGDFDLTNLAVELALLKSLSHEHLVKFKGVFAVDPRIMEGGKSSKKSSKSSCSNSGIGSSDCSGSNSNNSSSSAVASNYGSNQEHLPPFLLPPPWRAINATTCGFVGIITELCAEGSLDDFFKAHRSPPSLLHSSKSVANEGGGKEEGGPLSTAAVPLPSCHEASSTQEQLHHPGFPASPQDGPPWAWRLQWCKEPASALAHLLVEPLSSSSGYLFSQRSLNN